MLNRMTNIICGVIKQIHKKLVRSRTTRVLSVQIIPSTTIPSNWCFSFISLTVIYITCSAL